jgi:hypothetical protein
MKTATLKTSIAKNSTKKKRNLDNTELLKFFGKGSTDIWQKDIFTGEGNYNF